MFAGTPDQPFGDRLKRLMRERRETGRSLAEALGVHETTVSGWLRGRMRPEYDRVVALAAHFKVTERWLMDGEPLPRQSPALYVSDRAGAPYSTSSVQATIAAGQRHLTGWLAEYSAQLLEAAAADTRRQLGALPALEPAPDAPAHEGGTPDLKAAIDAAVVAQVNAQTEAARRAGKGAGGAGKSRRSAG